VHTRKGTPAAVASALVAAANEAGGKDNITVV
jgi:serine/threonine protein phosphatase PrpC